MSGSQSLSVSRGLLQLLARRSNGPAMLRISSHFGAIGLVGYAIWWVAAAVGLAWTLPLMIIQAWLVGFLFMPLHETAHKTAFENRIANALVGNVCAAAVVLPYEHYTLFHWAHHRHTQDPERDPELVAGTPVLPTISGLGFWFLGVRQLIGRTRLLIRHALTGKVTALWVPVGKRALVVREACYLAATYTALLLISIAVATTILLWTWLVPLIIGQAFLRPYLLAEHSGCGHSRDAFENTRTTFRSGLIRWFTSNMPYHFEHHAHPNIPFPCPAKVTLSGGR